MRHSDILARHLAAVGLALVAASCTVDVELCTGAYHPHSAEVSYNFAFDTDADVPDSMFVVANRVVARRMAIMKVGTADGKAVFTLGSGQYSFSTNISTKIDEVAEDSGIKVYPNPTDGLLHIKSSEPVVSLTLNDMAGNLVKTAGNNSDTFDISSVGKGIYLLTVETQNDTKTSKIIKK